MEAPYYKKRLFTLNTALTSHFRIYGAVKKAYSLLWKMQIKKQNIKLSNRIQLHYEIFDCPTLKSRTFDISNMGAMTVKIFEDTIVGMGLIPDDNSNYIIGYKVTYGGIKKDEKKVTFVVNIYDI